MNNDNILAGLREGSEGHLDDDAHALAVGVEGELGQLGVGVTDAAGGDRHPALRCLALVHEALVTIIIIIIIISIIFIIIAL